MVLSIGWVVIQSRKSCYMVHDCPFQGCKVVMKTDTCVSDDNRHRSGKSNIRVILSEYINENTRQIYIPLFDGQLLLELISMLHFSWYGSFGVKHDIYRATKKKIVRTGLNDDDYVLIVRTNSSTVLVLEYSRSYPEVTTRFFNGASKTRHWDRKNVGFKQQYPSCRPGATTSVCV